MAASPTSDSASAVSARIEDHFAGLEDVRLTPRGLNFWQPPPEDKFLVNAGSVHHDGLSNAHDTGNIRISGIDSRATPGEEEACRRENGRLAQEYERKLEEISAVHAEHVRLLQADHEEDLFALQAHLEECQSALNEERQRALEARGRREEIGQIRGTAKELLRHQKSLEGRVKMLQEALDEQQKLNVELASCLTASQAAEQSLEERLRTMERERDDAVSTVRHAEQRNNLEKAEAQAFVQQVSLKESTLLEAFDRIASCIGLHGESSSVPAWSSGLRELRCPEESGAIEFAAEAEAVCGAVTKVVARAKQVEAVENALKEERNRSETLEKQAAATQKSLDACREELGIAAAKAATAALEMSHLKSRLEECEEKRRSAEQQARAAEEIASSLQNGSQAQETRTSEMRAAAAGAVESAAQLQRSIRRACSTAVASLQTAAAKLSSVTASRGSLWMHDPKDRATEVVNAVCQVIDHLREVSLLSIDHLEDSEGIFDQDVSAIVAAALVRAADGYIAVAEMVEEHGHLRGALWRTLQDIEFPGESSGSLADHGDESTTLRSLLDTLLARLAALTDAAHEEKKDVHEALTAVLDQQKELQLHARSLESVLRSAVFPKSSAMMAADPACVLENNVLIEFAQARRRVMELEDEMAAMARSLYAARQDAEDAKNAASRDWSSVRSDIAQLVIHAERAEAEATAALHQQRMEAARQIDSVRSQAAEAEARRSAAEMDAAKAREREAALSREMERYRLNAIRAESRAVAAEHSLQLLRASSEDPPAGNINGGNGEPGSGALEPVVQSLEAALAKAKKDTLDTKAALAEARLREEALDEDVNSVRAELEAAKHRVQLAEEELTTTKARMVQLELDLLQLQTHLYVSGMETDNVDIANVFPPGSLFSGLEIEEPPSIVEFHSMRGDDAATMRRRLEAAQRQIESLRALNRNLEEQLGQRVASKSIARELKAVHSLIDALQDHMRQHSGALTGPVNDVWRSMATANGEDDTALERIVSLWRHALLERESSLEETNRKLRETCGQRESFSAQLASSLSSVEALQTAKEEAHDQVERLTAELDSARAFLQSMSQQARRQAELADQRVAAAEARASDLRNRIEELTLQLHKAEDVGIQQTGVDKKSVILQGSRDDLLRRAEEAESRVLRAEGRAKDAEEALARRLKAAGRESDTSLGKQLEVAWQSEQQLIRRVEELRLQLEAAQQRGGDARSDADAHAARAAALQHHLKEAVGALEEQGRALEGLQHVIREYELAEERSETSAWLASASETQKSPSMQLAELDVAEQRIEVLKSRLAVAQEEIAVTKARLFETEGLQKAVAAGATAVERTLKTAKHIERDDVISMNRDFKTKDAIDNLFSSIVLVLHQLDWQHGILTSRITKYDEIMALRSSRA